MTLRSLPRVFIPGADPSGPIELPSDEINKLRKVLRLEQGDLIAVLPNDGSLIVCKFEGKQAIPSEVHLPKTEPEISITIAQALPKGDKIDDVIRNCTELGVTRFLLFSAERTIVKWDAAKLVSKVARLSSIARESAELSYRMKIPTFDTATDLAMVLKAEPDAIVLSEIDEIQTTFAEKAQGKKSVTIVVGPEGGWAPREVDLIGERAVTLGPRVLRTEHAGSVAAGLLLI